MKKSSLRSLFAPVLGLSLVAGLLAQAPVPLPLETFFAEADCRDMQLAPDGKHLAFLTTLGYGKVGIALMDLTTGKFEPLVSAQDENIKSFLWKGSDYIVYGGDIGGDESPAWRSIAIAPPKPGEKRRVIALSEAYLERYNEGANLALIVDPLKYDPLHLLVFGRREAGSRSVGMFLLDVRNGRRSIASNYQPPPSANDFVTHNETHDVADNNGVLRARSRTVGRNTLIEVCPNPGDLYVRVAEFPADGGGWDLLFFAADNENLYLNSTEKSDTPTLHTYNVRTRQLSAPIFHPPEGEIVNVFTSWDRSVLYGVTYITDKPLNHFFDARRAQLQKTIDASLPDTFNRIVSFSQDEQTLLILAASDRDPGTYYILDRAHGRMGAVGKVRAPINPAQMQPMEPVTITARDGLVLYGYLTRPAGIAGRPGPLILNPHGGPYGIRDEWGFNPEGQFLASRGYAVLQVNYRGSGGYGGSFERAGFHEWGGKMQDDLTDAVKWAVGQGIADPARVAIYGASYGGYATLAGLVFTPELYCCGVNYVGPSDLGLLVGLGKNRGGGDSANVFYEKFLGDDREFLRAHSPLNYIERLHVPLLNAYGYNDPRVDIQHWTRLEARLKQFNKPYEIIIEDNEGHGFRNEKNRLAFYRRLEAFFALNLAPVRTDSPAAAPAMPVKPGN
jgi:dipeptidyl aminopeptidase/acylaminoacyl peptidase